MRERAGSLPWHRMTALPYPHRGCPLRNDRGDRLFGLHKFCVREPLLSARPMGWMVGQYDAAVLLLARSPWNASFPSWLGRKPRSGYDGKMAGALFGWPRLPYITSAASWFAPSGTTSHRPANPVGVPGTLRGTVALAALYSIPLSNGKENRSARLALRLLAVLVAAMKRACHAEGISFLNAGRRPSSAELNKKGPATR